MSRTTTTTTTGAATPDTGKNGVNTTRPSSTGTGGQLTEIKSRLVLLGESAVGKTSLVLQFVNGQFNDHQESTIGAAFFIQNVLLEEADTKVKFEIWDTAGQERFHSLAPMYYRNAPAAVVVYDITNHESFIKAQVWVKELQRQGKADVVIALAGNKTDLEERRDVTRLEAEEFAEKNRLVFTETSARTGSNVRELFIQLAKRVPNVPQARGGGSARDNNNRVDIRETSEGSRSSFKLDCCSG